MWHVDRLKILRPHFKALNDPLITGKDFLLSKLLCPQKQLTFERKESMVCSYLLHGYDIIQILKVYIEK